MANQKPSDRRKGGGDDGVPEPDLTPIMNLTFMLILALLTMAAILPMGLITIQAPQLGGGAAPEEEDKPKKKPLNLTIFVKIDGFDLAASGASLDGSTDGRPGQRLLPKLDSGANKVYDFAALTKKLVEIHKAFKNEQSVIIVADPDVIYEDIVKTMDAAREYVSGTEKDQMGKDKPIFEELFPAVAFSPGIMG
jgi:biopolymer transport protein ExbD